MPTKRTLTRHLAAARREIDRLIDQREDRLDTTTAALGNQRRMAQQLGEAQDEIARLRKEAANRPVPVGPAEWARERARLRQQLDLSERARASLDAQLVQLGQINDRVCREAYDRAVAAEVTA